MYKCSHITSKYIMNTTFQCFFYSMNFPFLVFESRLNNWNFQQNSLSYMQKVNLDKSQNILQKKIQHETCKIIIHNLKKIMMINIWQPYDKGTKMHDTQWYLWYHESY
jgi:hypothetical protein